MAAGGPVPVGQIAATIAAAGGGRTRSREPNRRDDRSRWRQQLSLLPSACLFDSFSRKERCVGGRSPFPFRLLSPAASCGKNAAAGGASRPLPSISPSRQPIAERTPRRRAPLAPLRKGRYGRPGRKKHLPIYNITCKNEKERPSRAKNIPCHKASPTNNKKQAADSGEKRSSPLSDGRHKKQKNRTPDLDVLRVWMRQQPNLPWGDPKVLSALESLTSVFGMRTGGSSPLSSPQWLYNPHALAHGFIYKL